MAPEEDPGAAPQDGPALASGPTGRKARGPDADTGAGTGAGADADAKDAKGDSGDGGPRGGLARGMAAIAAAVKTLPGGPGVYRMLDRKGEALYVGKAKNLKKRVATYAQAARLPRRLQRMVAATVAVEVVTTHTEVEALLLESNLIKRFLPRYNVLLRDDKSFPYILITGDREFPEITKHRGARNRAGDYFGPFASAGAVNRTITALEKAFLLRSCSDSVFAARTRPCLMHQIKRCAAPCVGRISKAGYGELVAEARDFLTGRSRQIQQRLAAVMQEASDRLDFETAATYRDRIRALAHIQARQDINVRGVEDADVIAAHQEAGQTCIQVFFFRAGRNYGNRAYYPSHDKALGLKAVLGAFLAQFYENKPVPKLVLISHQPGDGALIAEALSLRAGHKVAFREPKRGAKRKLVEHALANARDALVRRMAESSAQRALLEGLAECFALDAVPERIEVYDNSHIQGANPYGAMIVAGPEGFNKSAYRKFKIRGAAAEGEAKAARSAKAEPPEAEPLGTEAGAAKFTPGDDYAMMREVLTRRFSRALKEDPERGGGQWPDLILLDGGRGQLSSAREVLVDLGLGDLAVAAIAKGPARNAGRERIYLVDRRPVLLGPRDPVLYFLQRLRDEAHRFAIGSHRSGRTKARLRSALDEVPGVGAKRKKALLHHFGSARAVARAGLADLEAIEGISTGVARKIYDHFHAEG
ncbi:MAG: excinuclease ABC subunit UvrC [Proteobacteria bacterium]|nr:excinuclease ABC subunit UvrC [Pseudomonadota bacterium]